MGASIGGIALILAFMVGILLIRRRKGRSNNTSEAQVTPYKEMYVGNVGEEQITPQELHAQQYPTELPGSIPQTKEEIGIGKQLRFPRIETTKT